MRGLIAWLSHFAEQLRICDRMTALQDLQDERQMIVTRLANLRADLRAIDQEIASLEKDAIAEAQP